MNENKIDYIDEDVAYLLGLITARGNILEGGTRKVIVIDFPFVNMKAIGVSKKIDQKNEILISLDSVMNRIGELTEARLKKDDRQEAIDLVFEINRSTIFWRNIISLMGNRRTHIKYEIPPEIFNAPELIKKEFLRGYADVAGSARWSNRDQSDRCRVYLDILNRNWKLPIQLCHLLQNKLSIPVNTLTWGHPNIRDPFLVDYKDGRQGAWAREHQIKVYAEVFEKIDFYISHKKEILKELSEYNKEHFYNEPNFCIPPRRLRSKPNHPEENSQKLPNEIRGKHYDSYWQICCDLGCELCRNKDIVRQFKLE